MNAYTFIFRTLDGQHLMPLSDFRGKVLLIVNTASLCGFTPQYQGLETLYSLYKERGLVVIGVPSNEFGSQEPGSPKEIASFCTKKYHITFPLTAKECVTGKNAHPFYLSAKAELGMLKAPKWNFHKYLIDRNGQLVDYFASTTSPLALRVIKAIESLL